VSCWWQVEKREPIFKPVRLRYWLLLISVLSSSLTIWRSKEVIHANVMTGKPV
jgi:hypothetical protein